MLNRINTFDSFIKGSFLIYSLQLGPAVLDLLAYAHLCDIFNDHHLVLITIGIKHLPEVSCLLLRSDSPADRVSLFKKGAHHPNCDVAICARDQDLAGGLHSGHDVRSDLGKGN